MRVRACVSRACACFSLSLVLALCVSAFSGYKDKRTNINALISPAVVYAGLMPFVLVLSALLCAPVSEYAILSELSLSFFDKIGVTLPAPPPLPLGPFAFIFGKSPICDCFYLCFYVFAAPLLEER